MDEQTLCRKRLQDLANQAYRREIVTFSDFLNLNEQNIYHAAQRELSVQTRLFGGYDGAERQMVACIPDALSSYAQTEATDLQYPIACLAARPQYEKFAEKLSHRDILGAVMHLGIDRGKIGDIVCNDGAYYIFCEEGIHAFLVENLVRIRHTVMKVARVEDVDLSGVRPDLEERQEMIASNRIDCMIAKAYHLSRSEAAEVISGEQVFINGRCITNCNQSCESGAIVSVRGKGRFIFETDESLSKKGKLRVTFKMYL